MSIRAKIILIVLPLLVAPLLLTGLVSALSARNGITRVTTELLRFKAEELEKYAQQQWTVLQNNDLADNPEFVRFSQEALGGYARSLVRGPTELILAVDGEGRVAMQTSATEPTPGELAALLAVRAEGGAGWRTLDLDGTRRVAQTFLFAPFDWLVLVTERRDVFYQPVNGILVQTAAILAVTALLSVLLLLLLSGYLTRPLQGLTAAMSQVIETGDLSRRVEPLFEDETGRLGHTFNRMAAELESANNQVKGFALQAVVNQRRERRLRNIFQKYMSEEVISQFLRKPEAMREGENREVAVLFSDIRSFTTLSEMMRPHEVVAMLNSYFTPMVEVIEEHGGKVDKYLGDGLLALFGAPTKHEDDAWRAVQAGLGMLVALQEFNQKHRRPGRVPFEIGVGIDFGEVTVGNIGHYERKMDYTVVGDRVNLASRLEGLTRHFGESILISESVYRHVHARVRCRFVGRVEVKGRSGAVGIYVPKAALEPREEEAWKLHGEALKLYFEQRFQEAQRLFREVAELLPGDTLARMYLERCAACLRASPAEGWTGVEVMQQK